MNPTTPAGEHTMADSLTHWLDIIPAVYIAAGVPLVRTATYSDSGPLQGRLAPSGAREASECDSEGVYRTGSWAATVRVDLDDPQGVAYALLWLRSNRLPDMDISAWHRAWYALVCRWLEGRSTDEDRFVIAEAMADIVFGNGAR